MKLSTREASAIADNMWDLIGKGDLTPPNQFIGIPRGGVAAAYLIASRAPRNRARPVVTTLDEYLTDGRHAPQTWLVDDIYVTGETAMKAAAALSGKGIGFQTFAALVSKSAMMRPGGLYGSLVDESEWVEFPWEGTDEKGPEDAVRRLIEYAGRDPSDASLIDTPRRVLAFWDEWRAQRGTITYTAFETDSPSDDLVIQKGIPFYSMCEHHMLPYFGTCAIGYIPEGQHLGLSKLARIVTQQSSGLSIQEELTARIAAVVSEAANAANVGVVMRATHTCMVIRGPRAYGTETVTSKLWGDFLAAPSLRAEFLGLANG